MGVRHPVIFTDNREFAHLKECCRPGLAQSMLKIFSSVAAKNHGGKILCAQNDKGCFPLCWCPDGSSVCEMQDAFLQAYRDHYRDIPEGCITGTYWEQAMDGIRQFVTL